jgi:hypothetical protein
MRKVREVLRLRHALGLSYRKINEALGVGKTSAGEIVRRAELIGLTWPLPQLFDDAELERRLFTAPGEVPREEKMVAPGWAACRCSGREQGQKLSRKINWPSPGRVAWHEDKSKNSLRRKRNGHPRGRVLAVVLAARPIVSLSRESTCVFAPSAREWCEPSKDSCRATTSR